MAEIVACSRCGGEVYEDNDFCPHCGVLFDKAGQVACDTHPDQPAVGVCIICRRVLCAQCEKRRIGRSFCSEHRKVEVAEDWVKVFQSHEVTEADLARAVLQTAGFKVQMQNFSSIGYLWEGGGDSPVSRMQVGRPAKVFVPIPDFERALETLKEWDSGRMEASEDEMNSEDT